jgi:hypothetical protein
MSSYVVKNCFGPSKCQIVNFVGLVLSGDSAARLKFVGQALADPRSAASSLAAYFDFVVTHHEGSDDARDLDNWASTGADEDLDGVVWRATNPDLAPSLRFAYAAILAGVGQAAARPRGWRDAA